MRRILLSAVAFGAMTTAAMAEPQKMGEGQLGNVTGGVLTAVDQSNWASKVATANALNFGGKDILLSKGPGPITPGPGDLEFGGTIADAEINETQGNSALVTATKTVTKDLLGPIVVPCPCDTVKKDHGFKKDFSFGSAHGFGSAW